MLDNQTRRELLSKARQSGFPGSILDVFAAYEQGRDLVAEFQQQQEQQQTQQMSEQAAQQSGMQMPQQMQQEQPQQGPPQPQGPPQGLPQGSRIPQPPSPNTGLVNSNESQATGLASNASGKFGGQEILAMGGFREDEYNKFSTHFPFSKEQRGSIAHNATVEHPDLTMVRGKKYVFGGLKYETGGPVAKAVEKTLSRNEDIDPETMFYGKYNTPLNERQQKRFNNWAAKESERQGRDIMMDKGAYDIQGFWKAGDWKRMDADNHGTDTWKKPNHPTFSNLSKYHGADGLYGGNWTKEAGYQPSKQTANRYTQEYYSWMFGNEPGRLEHLDMSRYNGKNLGTPVVFKKGGFKYEKGGPIEPIKPPQPFPDYYNTNKEAFDAADNTARSYMTDWFSKRAQAFPEEHGEAATAMGEYLKNSAQSAYVPAGTEFKGVTGTADSYGFANEPDYRLSLDQSNTTKTLSDDPFSFPQSGGKIKGSNSPLNYNTAYYIGEGGKMPTTQLEEQLHLASNYGEHMSAKHADSFKRVKDYINPGAIGQMRYQGMQGNENYYGDTQEFYPRLMSARRTFGLDPAKKYTRQEMSNFLDKGYNDIINGNFTEPGQKEHLIEFYKQLGYPTPSAGFTKEASEEEIKKQKEAAAEKFRKSNDEFAMQKNKNSEYYPPLISRYGGYRTRR